MRRLLILLMLLLSLPQSLRAQGAQPTLDEYKQLIREAYAAATRSDRIGLDDVADRLAAVDGVRLADGRTAPADNTWLREALEQEAPDYTVLAARLGAILDASGQPRVRHSPDAFDRLDRVFSQPPFDNQAAPEAWTRFWQAVGQAIADFLNWLFGRGGSGGQAATPSPFSTLSPLGWGLLLAGLALVLGLVVYAVRSVRQTVIHDARARVAAEEAMLSSGEAWRRANEQARHSDYRTAVRYLYLSSLLWLDEQKILRYDRSRTNREYLEEVRSNPSLHQRLTPVIETFDRVWYGHRQLDEPAFQAYKRAIEALRNEETRS